MLREARTFSRTLLKHPKKMAKQISKHLFDPIDLDRNGSLASELKTRLEALFEKYGCDPTPVGWRELALRLAIEHEPALAVLPKFKKRHANLVEILRIIRLVNKGHTQAEAARLVWQENQKLRRRAKEEGSKSKTISPKTLEARYSEAKRNDRKLYYQGVLNFIKSVEEAAVSLESADRASTDYKRMPLKKGRAVRKSRLK